MHGIVLRVYSIFDDTILVLRKGFVVVHLGDSSVWTTLAVFILATDHVTFDRPDKPSPDKLKVECHVFLCSMSILMLRMMQLPGRQSSFFHHN